MAETPESCPVSMQARAAEAATEQAVEQAKRELEDTETSYDAAVGHYSKAVRDHERCAAAPASAPVRFVSAR